MPQDDVSIDESSWFQRIRLPAAGDGQSPAVDLRKNAFEENRLRVIKTDVSSESSEFSKQAGKSKTVVLWFPHAGGGTAALHRAARGLRPEDCKSTQLKAVELYALLMPGREARFSEPPVRRMRTLIEQMDHPSRLGDQGPILIGHSLGALVASRVAQWRRDRQLPTAGLIVLGMRSPDRLHPRAERLRLPDDQLAEQLDRDFGGVPRVIRENPEALRLFMPIVRADLEILESFADQGPLTLDLPIRALSGTDDPAADAKAMTGWAKVTGGTFEQHEIAGDHFFPLQRFAEVLRHASELGSPFPASDKASGSGEA